MPDDFRVVREQRFWNRYSNGLIKQGVKPDFVRRHVLRAKSFIKAFPAVARPTSAPMTSLNLVFQTR